ncbi:hypothetical protein ACJROX_27680 [Pseudalkalibacillus sp. A8]|uniref:hypothetical protein n=1 Tax=Pseudalkalibacillus sp. A8 TaxID=3382641 RepID=UPI0038B4925F
MLDAGQNFFDLIAAQFQPVFLALVVIFASFLIIKKSFAALIGFFIVGSLIGALVFNPELLVKVGTNVTKAVFGG